MKKSVSIIITLILVLSVFSSLAQATTPLSEKYWVGYEQDYEKGGTLYRVDKDGNNKEVIVNDLMTTFKVQGDWVYYMFIEKDDGHFSLPLGQMYRIKIDGTNKEKLSENDLITSFDISKNHVFYGIGGNIREDGTEYIDHGKLIKMNLDGSNKETISGDSIKSIIVNDDSLFYINMSDNDRIYKMDVNGKNKKKLTDGMVYYSDLWSIQDGWIIFYAGDIEANYASYMTRLDGTGEFMLEGSTGYNGHVYISKITSDLVYYKVHNSTTNLYMLYSVKTNGQNATKIDDLAQDKNMLTSSTKIEYTNAAGVAKTIILSGDKPEKTTPKDNSGITVTFNGEVVTFDTEPLIENGRTLLPMRAVFELLGATVNWDPKTSIITAKTKDATIELKIGSKSATVNGKKVELDQPAVIKNGRTLVPIRFVVEALEADITWDGKTSTISIKK